MKGGRGEPVLQAFRLLFAGRQPGAAMGGPGRELYAASRQEQPAGHAGILPARSAHAGTRGIRQPRSRGAGAGRCRCSAGGLLARTAAFLLLKDSKASYAIEGERPPQNRIQRWGRAIGVAGRQPIDLDELLRLQKIVIGDDRFVRLGLRTEGGFVGEHERDMGAPLALCSGFCIKTPGVFRGARAKENSKR